jgi:putative PEP-CTERM system TPR-repeat lipoprotein
MPRQLTVTLLVVLLGTFLASCDSSTPGATLDAVRQRIAQGDYPGAVIDLKSEIERDPENGELRFLLGSVLRKQADLAGAEIELDRARSLGFEQRKTLAELVELHLQRGQPRKAMELIESLDEKLRSEDAIRVQQADALFALGDVAKAKAIYESLAPSHPKDGRVIAGLARVASAGGKLDEAVDLVGKALSADPDSLEALQLQANLFSRLGKHQQAIAAFEKLLKVNAYHPAAYEGLVSAHLGAGDIPGAEAALGRYQASRLSPAATQYLAAFIANAKGEQTRSRDLLRELLKTTPDHEGANMLAGMVEQSLGNYPAAARHFRKVLDTRPDDPSANVMLGMGLLRSRNVTDAKALAEKLLRDHPQTPAFWALAGQVYLFTGENAKAIVLLQRAVQAAPDNSNLKAQLGEAQLRIGDIAGGVRNLREAAEQGVPDTGAITALVAHYLKSGDTKNAGVVVDGYLAKQPKQSMGYELQALVHLARKDTPAARKALDTAAELAPQSYRIQRQLVLLDLEAKQPDQAIKRLQDFTAANPRNADAVLLLVKLLAGSQSGGEATLKLLEKAISANPTDARLWREKVDQLLKRRDVEAAQTAAKQAAAALPGDPTVEELTARVQMVRGDLSAASYGYEKLAVTPKADIAGALGLADIHAQQQQWGKAREAVKRAIANHPNDLTLHAVLLDISQKSGDRATALKDAETIAAKWPDEPFGYLATGRLLTAANRQAEAEQAFRRGLAKTDNAAVLAELYGLLDRRGAAQAAEKEAVQWLGRHPNSPGIWAFVGDARVRRGDLAGAEEMFRKLVASQPTQIQALDRLARVLAKRDNREALDVAAKMVQLAPESAVALSSAGAVYLKFDRTSESVDLLKKAVAKMPSSPVVRLRYAEALKKTGDGAGAKQQVTEALALNPAGELLTALVDLQKSL